MRAEQARVIVDGLHLHLEARLRQVSAKSKLADAIRHALTRWTGLSLFLDDSRVERKHTPKLAITHKSLNRFRWVAENS
nr:IS66 family transposase [Novosphingobium sp. B-7]